MASTSSTSASPSLDGIVVALGPTATAVLKTKAEAQDSGALILAESMEPDAVFEPLVEFHYFQKLPTEMRLKIWKYALPTCMDEKGRRIVAINLLWVRRGQTSKAVFKIGRLSNSGVQNVGTSAEVFDIGMTRAIRESREVYLKEFPLILPLNLWGAGNGRKLSTLYFNDHTTIYISNYQKLAHKVEMRSSIFPCTDSTHIPFPQWTRSIKNLAINLSLQGLHTRYWVQGCDQNLASQEVQSAFIAHFFKNVETLNIINEDIPIGRRFTNGIGRFKTRMKETQPMVEGEQFKDAEKIKFEMIELLEAITVYRPMRSARGKFRG